MTLHYPTKRPHYWKVYHLSNGYSSKGIYKLVLSLCRKLGNPWKKSKRGRPVKFKPYEHAALCVCMRFFGYSYRDLEKHVHEFVSRTIDHSTVGWAMKRLPEQYTNSIVKLLYKLIDNLCKDESVYITDSTGITTDRYRVTMVLLKKLDHKQYMKWHIIAKYYPGKGIVSIVSSLSTGGFRHDSPAFRKNFDSELCNNGLLFADSAYDSDENLKLCMKHGLFPVIKIRDVERHRKRLGGKFAEMFDKELYRQYRGVVESVFGGSETKHGNRTRCRLEHTRNVDIIAYAIRHNINSYLRLIAVEKVRRDIVSYILLINSTTSP